MQDSTYCVTLCSPMGIKNGTVKINTKEECLMLTLLGEDNLFTGSFISRRTVGELSFHVTGSLKTALYHLCASLQGRISKDQLEAVLHTKEGDFPVTGTRCFTPL